MISVKLICIGSLKEGYLREAVAEYQKRLGAFCKFSCAELKEEKVPDNPSENEIKAVLSKEADKIFAEIPKKAYKIALCVEGKQLSSEELADKLDSIAGTHGELCLIIGSSHGLDDRVKAVSDMRLSFSKLTFPHQLMRVIALEALYRGFNIIKGTHYHK